MRQIVLDTETTGLEVTLGHRIIEIAAVEIVDRRLTRRSFHRYVNPGRDIDPGAQEVHGLSRDFLQDKPAFSEIAAEFLEFVRGAELIIHNAGFDVDFLNAELGRLGKPRIQMARVIDSLQLARRKHPGAQNSLDALCKRYQIDISGRTKHGALLDSELTAKVYLELIGGHQAKLNLASAGQTEARRQHRQREAAAQRPKPLPRHLTEDEIAAHRAFIDALGKEPLWGRYLAQGE